MQFLGRSAAEIARCLGRHRSTIGRECQRNVHGDGRYFADEAQTWANSRRRAHLRRPKTEDRRLMSYVAERLADRWSPEQIAGRLSKQAPPDLEGRSISHTTVYRWIWSDPERSRQFRLFLRIARKLRRKPYGKPSRQGQIVGKRSIEERPKEANARQRLGDWEGDTVVGFGRSMVSDGGALVVEDGVFVLRRRDWITIDGVAGRVYAGKGDIANHYWRDLPELVALASVIDVGLASGDVPIETMAKTWRMRDFFAHGLPLIGQRTSKRPVSARPYVSFKQPNRRVPQEATSGLIVIRPEDRENYSEILLSLSGAFLRQLSSVVGLGQHHLHFRPLWDPKSFVSRGNEGQGTQLVGFKYYDVNRYIPHLPDVATVTFLLRVEVHVELDQWFLDTTNPNGESLVVSSDRIQAFCLVINGAHVSYEDIPYLCDSLPRREYSWRFCEANRICRQDIVDFVSAWPSPELVDSQLAPLCFELGLVRRGRRTASGESLLGRAKRTSRYEFTEREK